MGQFTDKWSGRCKTNGYTINGLAALLVEKDDEMKVVAFAAGTENRRTCSYSLNSEIDECLSGYCDGHAVSVCYQLAIFYLITEMYRLIKDRRKDKNRSILKIQAGGYKLKDNVKIHFFSTEIPCGCMNNKDGCLLSWKIPFKEKPHCLECSSIILINAYLGIQGFLSHLFAQPVYISSITIAKCKESDATASKIKGCFEKLEKSLMKTKLDRKANSHYKPHIPLVEIAEDESKKLFPEYFEPCTNSCSSNNDILPAICRETENENAGAGAIRDIHGNLGFHFFPVKTKLVSDTFCGKMVIQLKTAIKELEFTHEIMVLHLDSLKEAQINLSKALNDDKPLDTLRNSLVKKINLFQCQGNETEQRRFITDKITAHVHKTLCTIMKNFESDHKVEAAKVSVHESMNELENIVVNVLTDYHDYQEALADLNKLLQKSIPDSQLLDLMGCDWARHLRVINIQISKHACSS